MYAKIANNKVISYPATPSLDNPSISFPQNWGGGLVANNLYVVVQETEMPTANLGWVVSESTPVQNNSSWYQYWTTTLKPKENLKIDITNKRYEVEVGGVRIANNLYSTDRESQTKYVAVAVDISQSNAQTWNITWKTQDNKFVNLNANQMLQVVNGVRNHVQNCFNKESDYYQLIDTANTNVLESTDFNSGWPSNN